MTYTVYKFFSFHVPNTERKNDLNILISSLTKIAGVQNLNCDIICSFKLTYNETNRSIYIFAKLKGHLDFSKQALPENANYCFNITIFKK